MKTKSTAERFADRWNAITINETPKPGYSLALLANQMCEAARRILKTRRTLVFSDGSRLQWVTGKSNYLIIGVRVL